MLTELFNANQTVLKSVRLARDNDIFGINSSHVVLEHGQSLYQRHGDRITLKDPSASHHFAVLWGGKADKMRHYWNIHHMRIALKTAWRDLDYTIYVLFGNGTTNAQNKPLSWANTETATRSNLQTLLTTLKPLLDADDQFLFYSTGHGSTSIAVLPLPVFVPPGGSDNEVLQLQQTILSAMNADAANTPTLEVQYSDLAASVEVLFNDHPIGDLDPTISGVVLDIPEELITFRNEISITNDTDQSFVLEAKDFSTGPLDPDGPELPRRVPAISHAGRAVLLLGLVVCLLVAFRRRSRSV